MSYDPEQPPSGDPSADRKATYRVDYIDKDGRTITLTQEGSESWQSGGSSDDEFQIEDFVRRLDGYTPRTQVTSFLLAANIFVFIAMVLTGVAIFSPTGEDLLRWGANFGPLTMGTQGWRLLTCTFVHGGLLHLGFNMWVLKDAGRFVERLYGNAGFLLLYLFSGIGGSLTTIWWNPQVISVGASGAIFGVCGALAAYLVRNRHTMPITIVKSLRGSVSTFLFYNIILGFMIPNIDMGAHLGGLAAGFVAGLILGRPISAAGVQRRRLANLIFLVVGPLLLLSVALPLRYRAIGSLTDLEEIKLRVQEIQQRRGLLLKQYELQRARYRRGDANNEQFARYIEQVIIPAWSKLESDLASTPPAPRQLQALINKEREAMATTTTQWPQIIEQLRTSKKPQEALQALPDET